MSIKSKNIYDIFLFLEEEKEEKKKRTDSSFMLVFFSDQSGKGPLKLLKAFLFFDEQTRILLLDQRSYHNFQDVLSNEYQIRLLQLKYEQTHLSHNHITSRNLELTILEALKLRDEFVSTKSHEKSWILNRFYKEKDRINNFDDCPYGNRRLLGEFTLNDAVQLILQRYKYWGGDIDVKFVTAIRGSGLLIHHKENYLFKLSYVKYAIFEITGNNYMDPKYKGIYFCFDCLKNPDVQYGNEPCIHTKDNKSVESKLMITEIELWEFDRVLHNQGTFENKFMDKYGCIYEGKLTEKGLICDEIHVKGDTILKHLYEQKLYPNNYIREDNHENVIDYLIEKYPYWGAIYKASSPDVIEKIYNPIESLPWIRPFDLDEDMYWAQGKFYCEECLWTSTDYGSHPCIHMPPGSYIDDNEPYDDYDDDCLLCGSTSHHAGHCDRFSIYYQ